MEILKFSYKTGRSETQELCSSSEHPLECMQGMLLPAHPFWEGTFTCLAAFVFPQPTLPEQQLSWPCTHFLAAAFSTARP